MASGNRYILTYHKCGSNWFRNIFKEIAERRGMNWRVTPYSAAKVNEPVDRGSPDSLIVIRGGSADALKEEAGRRPEDALVRCIRDPRDALISQYWSWKNSHQNNTPEILEARQLMEGASLKDALLWLTRKRKLIMARQIAELGGDELRNPIDIRYEDLLADFHRGLAPALEHLGLEIGGEELEEIRIACSFEKKTRRKPGEIDESHHLRRGEAGEWRESFDAELREAFKSVYGSLVLELGYSADQNW
jgi:hypothetical protein